MCKQLYVHTGDQTGEGVTAKEATAAAPTGECKAPSESDPHTQRPE